ncbi:MAG TPA: glycosyltransferase family 1 protein, partial [Bryobacterales bacterium]|nr:glycosyltransferase family 1 protein [Bryobacterales bacterium]
APSILTLHDLSPWAAGDRRAVAAGRIRRRTPFLLRLATMIVTPSEAIRHEAIEKFNLPPSRVVPIPLAAGPLFHPRSEPEIAAPLARLGVRPPYLLFLGARELRKNIPRLVAAWREARRERPDLSLVLAGRPAESSVQGPGLSPSVLNLEAEPGLIVPGVLDDGDLAALVAGAAVFVYPSLYEGFGLPVLEAMQSGVAAVISRDPALLEVAGVAAVAVDADSTSALARAIVELVRDPKRRLEYQQLGIRRASQFSWRRTAIRTREVYVEALRRF